MKLFKRMSTILLAVMVVLPMQMTAFATYNTRSTGRAIHGNRYESGDEIMLVKWNQVLNQKQFRKGMYADTTPNSIQNTKTVPAKGITQLNITTDYFGVVIEPTDKKEFTIDLQGVKYPTQVKVVTESKNGVLSVGITGESVKNFLMSTVTNNRINVIRIGVPAGALTKIQITDTGTSCILVDNVDVPVNASIISGITRVQGSIRKSPITMEGTSGDLLVLGSKVDGQLKLNVTSGDILLKATDVTGHTTLTATSGDVDVKVGSVTNAVFTATTGDVDVEAGSLTNAEFVATSGDVDATVGVILGSVSAKVSSGDLSFDLLTMPANLTFYFDGNTNSEDVSLPRGWKNGYTVGTGKPTLRLGVTSGDIDLEVG